jgi:hypothetical protein
MRESAASTFGRKVWRKSRAICERTEFILSRCGELSPSAGAGLLLPALGTNTGQNLNAAAALAAQRVVSIRARVCPPREDGLEFRGRELVHLREGEGREGDERKVDERKRRAAYLVLIIDDVLQPLFAELSLDDLLLNGTGPHEAVDVTPLLLTFSPDATGRLLVAGRIPVRIKEDEAIGADKIDATAAGLARQEKGEATILQIVELCDEFGSLRCICCSIQARPGPAVVFAHR